MAIICCVDVEVGAQRRREASSGCFRGTSSIEIKLQTQKQEWINFTDNNALNIRRSRLRWDERYFGHFRSYSRRWSNAFLDLFPHQFNQISAYSLFVQDFHNSFIFSNFHSSFYFFKQFIGRISNFWVGSSLLLLSGQPFYLYVSYVIDENKKENWEHNRGQKLDTEVDWRMQDVHIDNLCLSDLMVDLWIQFRANAIILYARTFLDKCF